MVVLPVHDIAECEETSRGDKTESVWVQITLRKDGCSSAAVIQGCIRILMKASYVFRKVCSTRDFHYYRFEFLTWRKIATSIGWAQVFLNTLADIFLH